MNSTEDPVLLQKVASELEQLRDNERQQQTQQSDGMPFPKSCRKLLSTIPGNSRCVDCGCRNPDWASVTYGVLLCMTCSGRHRSYGVGVSRVRSISMDAWSHSQVVAMLEGGGEQLQSFYARHGMGTDSDAFHRRYQTKAARFYRQNMESHVKKICQLGTYKGRAASRKAATSSSIRTTAASKLQPTSRDVRNRLSLASAVECSAMRSNRSLPGSNLGSSARHIRVC
mmetsp:Transcript_5691/g.10599  ORF Transcript_5691/g.10599 Transcript_5691/m.10599 type:complete len:227 (+) Transcript_5691:75-755(+)